VGDALRRLDEERLVENRPHTGAWVRVYTDEDVRALYELRCLGCHSESVHARAKRTARDFDEVRRWVERWNVSLSLAWSAEEVDDVTLHLNDAYYRYPCPPSACKVVSQK